MSGAVRQYERGQTLPLTLAGTIAILVFGFFALNYANTLRWQVRAQSAADSAAQAILTLQTQEFNALNTALYAAGVEEYRLRQILNGMVLASHYQGGCRTPAQCLVTEGQLEAQYDRSVSRYTDDIKTLQRVTATLNYNAVVNDSQALMTRIRDCTSSLGGDCAFHYGPLIINQRQDTQLVDMDAKRIERPYPGVTTGQSNVNGQLFAPVDVEVSACAVVPSLIPNFLNWKFAPFRAIARGAATPAMVEEDWMQPGTLLNPFTSPNVPYQPQEQYVPGPFNQWYDLDFGGNANVVVQNKYYQSSITNSGFFSVYIGWWNSIPIHAFTGAKTPGELGCAS